MIIKKQFLLFVTLFLNFLLLAEKIKINNSVLEVVIADTKQSRNQGLMFIDSLDKNMTCFLYGPSLQKMYVDEKYKIPLSVAFIDENYLIRELKIKSIESGFCLFKIRVNKICFGSESGMVC